LAALLFVLAGFPTRASIVFLIAASAAAAVATWRQSNRMLQAALFGVGLFATLIPEFVALQGDIGRMNTVFKFYLQAWVLLSISAAVALGWLARRAAREPLLRSVRPAWVVFAALLVVAAVAYPLFATQGKVGLRFADLPLSLDGMDYMQFAQYSDQNRDLNLPGDYAALRWMQQHVAGTPVVLEGRAPIYHWGSRVSIYTGLPTVLGWDWHETQQRSGDNGAGYGAMIQARAQDVERAYASPDVGQALSILSKYGVQWVYIGGLERAYYPAIGLDKFRNMPGLHLVYDADGVEIYQVVQP
jgi:YYY domain-containing protein